MFNERDDFAQAVQTVNRLIGIREEGLPKVGNLPQTVDITPIWEAIAPTERDPQQAPHGVEIFWGTDSSKGRLICTELVKGEEYGVTPTSQENNHLIGSHCHPRHKRPFRLFGDNRPELAPREMASMLDMPNQYAEFIIDRSPRGRNYFCVLAIKTLEASSQRYGRDEDTKQELSMWSTLVHEPIWRRDRAFLEKGDRFASEKGIAVFRGQIDLNSTRQPPLRLIKESP